MSYADLLSSADTQPPQQLNPIKVTRCSLTRTRTLTLTLTLTEPEPEPEPEPYPQP